MEQEIYTEALVYTKRFYNHITELFSLTEQLAEAVDRDDQVSMRMLISMREEPIYKMRELEAIFHDQLNEWPAQDAAEIRRILEGGTATTKKEERLANALAANRRFLLKFVELDQRISRKLCGEKSFYASKEQKG